MFLKLNLLYHEIENCFKFHPDGSFFLWYELFGA